MYSPWLRGSLGRQRGHRVRPGSAPINRKFRFRASKKNISHRNYICLTYVHMCGRNPCDWTQVPVDLYEYLLNEVLIKKIEADTRLLCQVSRQRGILPWLQLTHKGCLCLRSVVKIAWLIAATCDLFTRGRIRTVCHVCPGAQWSE